MKQPQHGGIPVAVKWILAVAVVGGLLFAARQFELQTHFRKLLEAIDGLGVLGYAVFFMVYVLACVFFIPGSVLTLGAGALYGVVVGSLLVSVSSTVGATAAFLVGRYLARDWVARKVEKNAKFNAIDQAVGAEGWKIVGLTRLSPVFPFSLLNYAYGLTQVSLRDYFLASWIGMMPGTVMYVYLGSLARLGVEAEGGGVAQVVLRIVGLLATVAVTVYITVVARNALRKRVDAGKATGADSRTASHASVAPRPFAFAVEPLDRHNKQLLANVHPSDWSNPNPAPIYNLVVVGAGTAGLITAAGAAGLGAKVALVERHLMGGDCLNVGCVPSKALIKPARLAAEMRNAAAFGLSAAKVGPDDFPKVMERLRTIRSHISRHDSARRYRDELGVEVFIGEARFSGRDTIEVDGRQLRFKKAVIATGARAIHPPEEGLAEVGFRTNETIFNLTELPRHLIVIGGGPIGCELAQAFRRLGAEVSLVQRGRFLPREDADASALIARIFEREGIRVLLDAQVKRAFLADGRKQVVVERQGKEETLVGDEILIGGGRAPNVEGLNLEAAGIEFDTHQGIKVNDRLQTTHRHVYAAGDCCMAWKFTHAADAAARIVIQNALFMGRAKLSALAMPWCTYTDPEVAHVGMYEADAQARGIEIDTFQVGMDAIDRAQTDGETEGFINVLVRRGTDKIVGATIVSAHAGEMIGEITTAMVAGKGLKTLAGVIHPYPTQAEAVKRVADAYSRTRLTPKVKKLFAKWLDWKRN